MNAPYDVYVCFYLFALFFSLLSNDEHRRLSLTRMELFSNEEHPPCRTVALVSTNHCIDLGMALLGTKLWT